MLAASAVAEESVPASVCVSEVEGVVAALSLEPQATADIAKTAAMVNTTSFFFIFVYSLSFVDIYSIVFSKMFSIEYF